MYYENVIKEIVRDIKNINLNYTTEQLVYISYLNYIMYKD